MDDRGSENWQGTPCATVKDGKTGLIIALEEANPEVIHTKGESLGVNRIHVLVSKEQGTK